MGKNTTRAGEGGGAYRVSFFFFFVAFRGIVCLFSTLMQKGEQRRRLERAPLRAQMMFLPARKKKKKKKNNECPERPAKWQNRFPPASPLFLAAFCAQIALRCVDPCLLLTSRAFKTTKNVPQHSLAGRACYYGGDPTAASSHFRAATQLDDAGLPAWEGVALTQVAAGDYLGAAKTYEELVRFFFWGVGVGGRKKRKKEGRGH